MSPASTIALYSRFMTSARGVQILLVARVVPVLEKAADLARRRRGHEDVVRVSLRGGVLEVLDVALHRGPVLPRHRPRARRPLLERRRELPGHLGPLREFLGVRIGPGRALAREAGETVLHVHGIVRPALLAVVDDRDARLALLLHDLQRRRARAAGQGGLVVEPPFLALLQ